ncbi:cobalt-precorrin-6A reductase [Arthrobacter sp. SLBN-53]|uniref:cobalt-precorrin-6A reductase n=1 Tax=Arthrobacter sp. SLBN-53 TaxID=2768412 RepID=UPI0011514F10|nr:cobalt-precorrin-6A reductase [Arthrobacter sp. SLBN-53]TQK27087.1 precorrin-6A/cobalt-precorrin-6A reductase [Arthrobacter sp. SLBN-53]
MRVLLLGGTGEARDLAARLHPGITVISSLAGRVPDPALPVGEVRIGGFGGADGLADWLTANAITAVVDATHPFAATITANAARAAARVGVPHVVLARPAWPHGDAIVVPTDTAAAQTVSSHGYRRVFLTTGRSGTAAFRGVDAWFLIRAVTPPEPELLPDRHRLVLSRGPYHLADELKLLRENGIDALVTKNSGGAMTQAKLDAAGQAGVPVIMVDRPALPDGVASVHTVDAAVEWVRSRR